MSATNQGGPDLARVRRILAAQDGIITVKQTALCGLSRSAVTRRCASGEWQALGFGVFHATDHRLSTPARLRAAVWGLGAHAMLGGPAALYWHGLPSAVPTTIHVNVPRGRSARTPLHRSVGVVVTWHRRLDPTDCVTVRNVRTSSRALAVLDSAALLGMAVVDRSLQSKQVTLADLAAAHRRYPHRRGAAAVGPMLTVAESGARSAAEREALERLFRTADLPPCQLNYPAVPPYEVDVAFVAQKVAVEIDGMAYHSDAQAFQHDRTRGNVLAAAGWIVLHFTWADIVERPEQTLAVIRRQLARAA
ncbi:MAG: type IV toxin-antitoxin system AbiEi family antitoxin domain-containing protein [Gordonia sp. (in: high G+C Gram-positive bacteria)]|uniref:DUF559 domain-containing protein n=1 Tax=Gordonia sp. (in: high G+C Gram-positive bacteria) TaxID=84139 RepID=UPI003BB60430